MFLIAIISISVDCPVDVSPCFFCQLDSFFGSDVCLVGVVSSQRVIQKTASSLNNGKGGTGLVS